MIRVGLVLYEGFQVINMSVATVFEYANQSFDEPRYEVTYLSEHGGLVKASFGAEVNSKPFDDAPYDTLLVFGDSNATVGPPGMVSFLRESAPATRRLGGSCTGAFNLAAAGLLHGKRATTHWAHAVKMRREYPEVKVHDDKIFIHEDGIWTSAGATACIDLALALVEEDVGVEVAKLVAKKLVVYHRRMGGQSQFSALLELAPRTDRIQSALAYAKSHLDQDLSIEHLANVVHLSTRQFARAFSEETGMSPAKAIERLRTEAARVMIESSNVPIEAVARDTGFGDPDRMRRAFLRVHGKSPQVIRREAKLEVDA